MRAFDLLSRAEYEIRSSSQPRHAFEMALVRWIHLRQLTPLTDLIQQLSGSGGRSAPSSAPVSSSSRSPAPPFAPSGRSAPATPTAPAARAEAAAAPRPAATRPQAAPAPAATGGEVKALILSAIREQNKAFYGMVVAQAQKVEVDGTTIAFTFAPVHKSLRTQLDAKKSWIEQIGHSVSGRTLTVVSREGQAVAAAADTSAASAAGRQAELRARAKAQPEVQAVLDVFGGEIEEVEELDGK
jgi:DNA polymerase-3 subunit gamma/tau